MRPLRSYISIQPNAEIVAKAVDSAANLQPEKVEDMESERNPQHFLASNQNTEFSMCRKIQDVKLSILHFFLRKLRGTHSTYLRCGTRERTWVRSSPVSGFTTVL